MSPAGPLMFRIGCSATGLGAMSLAGTCKFVGIYRELNGKPEYLVITPKVYVLFSPRARREEPLMGRSLWIR
jgi:hypothetical protein